MPDSRDARRPERRGALVCLAAMTVIGALGTARHGIPVRPEDVPSRLVDVNGASEAEIALLPGLGPDRARRIVIHREIFGPFRSIEDVTFVKGIGPSALERVRGCAVAGRSAP